jgi:hypothetical protein
LHLPDRAVHGRVHEFILGASAREQNTLEAIGRE